MRIAVASDDGIQIAAHTGRCQGFAIFDIEGQSAVRAEYRQNGFTAHARGECHGDHATAGEHHSHGTLVNALADCRVLVTRGLGPRLLADLAARGIDAYVCAVESVEEAVSQFAQGQLLRASSRCCCGH